MANPKPCRKWDVTTNLANQLLGSLDADQKYLMWQMKQALVGAIGVIPVGQWAVVQSSTATQLGASGIDLWANWSDIERPGTSEGPYSWILLQRKDGTQMCLTITIDASWCEFSIDVSPSGAFTGGSAGVPPTATDNINAMRNSPGAGQQIYGNNGTSDFQYYQHIWQSSDGTQTRVLVQAGSTGGDPFMYLAIDTPSNPDPAWVNPLAVTYQFAGANQVSPNTILSRSNPQQFFSNLFISGYQPGVGGIALYASIFAAFGTYNIDSWPAPNEMSGEYYLCQTGLLGTTDGARGTLGNITDLWWYGGPDGHAFTTMGVYYDGTLSVLVANNAVLPWPNGVVPAGTPTTVGPMFGAPCNDPCVCPPVPPVVAPPDPCWCPEETPQDPTDGGCW